MAAYTKTARIDGKTRATDRQARETNPGTAPYAERHKRRTRDPEWSLRAGSPRCEATLNGTPPGMLERLKVHDAEAWTSLVATFGPVVFQRCRQCGLQSSDAEDVVQDVFLSVARHLKTFDAKPYPGTFAAWIWAIARSRICDHFRRLKHKESPVGGPHALGQAQQIPDPESVVSAEPPEGSVKSLAARRVWEVIRGDFDDSTRQAFWRMVVDEDPSSEIAADLGKRPDTVRQAKRRVLRRFRDEWRRAGQRAQSF